MTQFSPVRFAAAALLAFTLGGCATSQQEHSHGSGSTGSGGDMHAMCEMHKKSMAGHSDADRKAMMEERIRSMPPDRRKQMQEMMANCR
ncbi:MAG TPA: hypothetical protein VFH35_03390 [Ramlibacter sp.]|nr:hypothetical protein [Ramlibacter sp.]